MSQDLTLKKIATIHTDFPEKFGLPRQSGLANTTGRIIFEPEYRNPEALRGIENYSHLWLLWGFSMVHQDSWHATVRPPRLGGNQRVGVFATRSPFRPNPLGLSCVELISIEETPTDGRVLLVSGIDMMDGTPIYDIKPYLPYVDAKPEAKGSFSDLHKNDRLQVVFQTNPETGISLEDQIPPEKQEVLRQILSQDPRPSYQEDPSRIYGLDFAGMQIKFFVGCGVLTVCQVMPLS